MKTSKQSTTTSASASGLAGLLAVAVAAAVAMTAVTQQQQQQQHQQQQPSISRSLPDDLLRMVTNPPDVETAIDLLSFGPGFVVYPGLIPAADIAEAQAAIERELGGNGNGNGNGDGGGIDNDNSTAPSAKGAEAVHNETGHDKIYADSKQGKAKQGLRVWNLLAKGQVFERMVQPTIVMEVAERILGDDFCLGSFAANTIGPGAGQQNPHVDYPYWDMTRGSKAWPVPPKGGDGHPFFMNLQMAVMLDDFTLDNGATAVLPYSQRLGRWPDPDEWEAGYRQVTGTKGTVFLFTGLLHHCSMTNRGVHGTTDDDDDDDDDDNSTSGVTGHGPTAMNSDQVGGKTRTSILGQYLPKYVRPMEDSRAALEGLDVIARATPRMRQLLGFHQPYPKNFD